MATVDEMKEKMSMKRKIEKQNELGGGRKKKQEKYIGYI